jgi:AcrR family transcriptional regulator
MAVPIPPWARPPRPAPARPPLTQQAIVEAALGVLDREGPDALTMRRVAEALHTGAASLYAHVRNKDELLDLLFDRVIGEVTIPEPDPPRWQEQLKDVARDLRRVFTRHPGMAQVSLGRIPTGPNAIVAAERLMAIARAGGLPDRAIAYLVDLLALYVGAIGYEDSVAATAHGLPSQDALAERLAQMRDYFASLPPERFPNSVALAGLIAAGDTDDRFEFGLEVLTRGLAASADARSRASARRRTRLKTHAKR